MLTQNVLLSKPKMSFFSRRSLLLFFLCGFVVSLVLLMNIHQQWLVASSSPVMTVPRQPLVTLPTKTTSASRTSVSQALIRLDQSSPAQYASVAQHDTWWESACSAAAMTEIINAYEHKQYRIADILAIEAGFQSPQVISPQAGLLYLEGIDRTMVSFGLHTTRLSQPSLQQIVKLADAGTPVLVNFPPDRFAGGHFLVVLGGTSQQVSLADSSRLHMQSLSSAQFASYWGGFAETFVPQSSVTSSHVLGQPTVSPDFINKVFGYYGSPAAGKGQALYNLGVKYGIDPVFALAFFGHESTFGTRGEAAKTMSLGNLRCIASRPCVDQQIGGGYAQMRSWEDGFEVWYQLIRNLYVAQWGATTVDLIIPHYAPSSDNNDEVGYITALKQSIARARAGLVAIEDF